jgi:hypothetical protein
MPPRPLTNNQYAAALAFWAGLVFLAIGWNGIRIYGAFFGFLSGLIPGPNPGLDVVAALLTVISPLSAASVIAGAVLLLRDQIRLGKIVVLFGTGAGIFSLILFLVLLVRRPGGVLAHEGAIPALLGVVLSLAARMKAKVPETAPKG